MILTLNTGITSMERKKDDDDETHLNYWVEKEQVLEKYIEIFSDRFKGFSIFL